MLGQASACVNLGGGGTRCLQKDREENNNCTQLDKASVKKERRCSRTPTQETPLSELSCPCFPPSSVC